MIAMKKMGVVGAGWFILLLAQSAQADPVGLITVDKTDPLAQSLGLTVCNVHVLFESPNDKLLQISFVDIATNDPDGFFQHPFGGNTAPLQALVPLFPELGLDSFVTIGLKTNDGSDNTYTDPDFDST